MASQEWMEPASMNTGILREVTIEKWMLSILRDGGIERYDDLHIDEIDDRWKARDCWIDGAVEAFTISVRLRDRHQLPLTVALGLSLNTAPQPIGVDFGTVEELYAALDWSPPSLYLFQAGQEPWFQVDDHLSHNGSITNAVVHSVKLSPVLGTSVVGTGYLLEFRSSETGGYSRTLFVANAPRVKTQNRTTPDPSGTVIK